MLDAMLLFCMELMIVCVDGMIVKHTDVCKHEGKCTAVFRCYARNMMGKKLLSLYFVIFWGNRVPQ